MNNNKESAPEIAGRQYEFADYKKEGSVVIWTCKNT